MLQEWEIRAMVWEVLNVHPRTKALLDNGAIMDAERIFLLTPHYIASAYIYSVDKRYVIKIDVAKEEIIEIRESEVDSSWLNIEL